MSKQWALIFLVGLSAALLCAAAVKAEVQGAGNGELDESAAEEQQQQQQLEQEAEQQEQQEPQEPQPQQARQQQQQQQQQQQGRSPLLGKIQPQVRELFHVTKDTAENFHQQAMPLLSGITGELMNTVDGYIRESPKLMDGINQIKPHLERIHGTTMNLVNQGSSAFSGLLSRFGQQGADAAQQGTQQAGQFANQAKDAAGNLMNQATQQAASLTNQAQDSAKSAADFANQAQNVAGNLASQAQGATGKYASKATESAANLPQISTSNSNSNQVQS